MLGGHNGNFDREEDQNTARDQTSRHNGNGFAVIRHLSNFETSFVQCESRTVRVGRRGSHVAEIGCRELD